MKKYSYKYKFSYLCTPIDIVYFFIFFCVCVFSEKWRQILVFASFLRNGVKYQVDAASAAFGVKCPFTHYFLDFFDGNRTINHSDRANNFGPKLFFFSNVCVFCSNFLVFLSPKKKNCKLY